VILITTMLFSVIKKTLAVASAIPALTATLPVGHLEVGVTALKLTRRNEVFQHDWLTDLSIALGRCLSLCSSNHNSSSAATAQAGASRTALPAVDASSEYGETEPKADLKVAAVEPAAAAATAVAEAADARESAAVLAAAVAAKSVTSAVNEAAVGEAAAAEAAAEAEATAAKVAAAAEATAAKVAAEAVAEAFITNTANTLSIASDAPNELIKGEDTAASAADATVVAHTAEKAAAENAPFKPSIKDVANAKLAAQTWIDSMVTESADEPKPWKYDPSFARILDSINRERFDNSNPNYKGKFTASQKADIVNAVRTGGIDEYGIDKYRIYNDWNGNKRLFSDNDILGLVKQGKCIKIEDLGLDYVGDDRSRITKTKGGKYI
jgi:hypothetical protein